MKYFDDLLPQVTNIRNMPESEQKTGLIEVAIETLDDEVLRRSITQEERDRLQAILEGRDC